eukprot:gnl/Dysnectes_brevis/6551_a10255_362.p1 GENE.gnl/Dysnectes_brevis/6551_a10255_362~~gnl/Dysnectes_brevis/6551_a10255_362.p1  ORF type:complete len:201 (+),score=22.75 gnl/Dysnectes_brevis/6551_a10255_362:90-692(+)
MKTIQSARWSIARAENQELLIVSRVDNLLNATALFLLGYYGFQSLFASSSAAEFIRWAVPILLVIIAGTTLFTTVVHALMAFLIRTEANSTLKEQDTVLPNMRIIILSTSLVRAISYPVILMLLWAFVMVDFQLAEVYYTVTFTMLGALLAILAALFVSWLTWRSMKNDEAQDDDEGEGGGEGGDEGEGSQPPRSMSASR